MLLILISDGLLNHLNNNFVDFDDFFGVKFFKAKLHALIKDLGFDEVDDMVPLFLLIWKLLNLGKELFCIGNEHLQCWYD